MLSPIQRNRSEGGNPQPGLAQQSDAVDVRDPSSPGDPRGPPRGYHTGVNSFVRDVFVRYVRRAQYRYGGGYYLIPAGNVLPSSDRLLPARCYTEQTAALRAELPHMPKRLRTRALLLQADQLDWERYRQQHPEGICLAHLNDAGFGGGGCGATLAQQEQNIGLGLSQGDSEGGWIQAAIVPDGIARITYIYPPTRSAHSTASSRPFKTTVPVINNLVVFKIPPGVDQSPSTVILRAAHGSIVRTVHPG